GSRDEQFLIWLIPRAAVFLIPPLLPATYLPNVRQEACFKTGFQFRDCSIHLKTLNSIGNKPVPWRLIVQGTLAPS
ncbi:MAG: hypothetical protein ACREAC_02635, partial [Blastocatellia bacterium]